MHWRQWKLMSGSSVRLCCLAFLVVAACLAPGLSAQEPAAAQEPVAGGEEGQAEPEATPGGEDDEENSTARDEAALNEDPEAQRRSQIEEEPELRITWPSLQFYGSARLHVINNFDAENKLTDTNLGDGASRVGVRGEWQVGRKFSLFGRFEGGFDVIDTFTPKAGDENEDKQGLRNRLFYGGIDSKNLTATFGKNWSAYYKIAGMADRFSIFGGSAAGIYNAGTDGGATGTGRADEVLQARIYTNSLKALRIKPFNLNVQYQEDQPIPQVEGRRYGSAVGASAWLESLSDQGFGVAFQRTEVEDPEDPQIRSAGIDGDAEALALAFRKFGDRWYAALVVAWLENINVTDQKKYVNGRGAELYIQWEFSDRWWLIAGGNWFKPYSDDPEAGEYDVLYGVIGLRFTLDSFNRMLYAEYRIDDSRLYDGTIRKNELTLGFRWDFGH
jgi:predicted porin